MRIAFLSTFYPFRGGIAQFNADLYRALEKEGADISAFTFSRQYPNILFPGSSQYVTNDDKVDEIPSVKSLDTINPLSYLSTAKKIKKYNPDIVLSKFWLPFFGPSLGTVLKSTKKYSTNISIIDNAIPHEKRIFDESFTKYYLKQNHKFIVMSESVKNDLLSIYKKADVTSFPHPLYDHFPEKIDKILARQKLGLEKTDKIMLFFGFIRDYKGLDLLLESMVNLPNDYKLIIAGEIYGDFKKYNDIIEKNNLQGRVIKLIRYIDDREVPELFSATDVCMLTYKSATQSGILGIAYNYNIPVIATDTGGMREMIEPYNSGLVIPIPKPNLISNALKEFFETKRDYFSGIEKFKEIASWKNLAKKIMEIGKINQASK